MSGPPTACLRPAVGELLAATEVWEARAPRRGGSLRSPLSGRWSTGPQLGTIVLRRIENGVVEILERRPRGGDAPSSITAISLRRCYCYMAPTFCIASGGVTGFAAVLPQLMIEGAWQVVINQFEHNVLCRQEVCAWR